MRRVETTRGVALDAAKREIAARLAHVCENLGPVEFAALVEKMAEIEVRYRNRDEWLFHRDTRAYGRSLN
jgi:hypothetical protein